jgi:hypothetical protein
MAPVAFDDWIRQSKRIGQGNARYLTIPLIAMNPRFQTQISHSNHARHENLIVVKISLPFSVYFKTDSTDST